MKTSHETLADRAAAPAPTTATSARQQAPAQRVAALPTSPTGRVHPRDSKRIKPAAVFVVSAICIVAAMTLAWYLARRGASATAQPEAPPSEVATVQPAGLQAPVAASAPAAAATRPRVAKSVVEKPKRLPIATTAASSPDGGQRLPARIGNDNEVGESAASAVDANRTTGESAAQPNLMPGVTNAPVTITGCLETTVDEDRFRLTDTEGLDAPKARSWRSGFLKKKPAPVELVDVPDLSGLRKYVGHRVVATGLLTSRELRVRSLQPAGVSCN